MAKFLDFGAVAKTNWAKPEIDKRPLWLIAALCAVLSLIFIFTPAWVSASFTMNGKLMAEGSAAGISSFYGIVALISVIVIFYGLLYRQYGFAVVGAALATLMALIFLIGHESAPMTCTYEGAPAKDMSIKMFLISSKQVASMHGTFPFVSSGAMGSLLTIVSGAVTAICSYLLYKKSNK